MSDAQDQKKSSDHQNGDTRNDKKRKAASSVETLEKELNDKDGSKKQNLGSVSQDDENIEMDVIEQQEKKMLEELDELTKVRDVENSTLKIGYNEEDYEVTTQQWENCIHEYIQPKGYQRDEKWRRPKELDKVYKFKLDKF